ncbi:hypothetical protein RSJ21_00310 (plasmid) [Clostridium botulinum]|uniref:hypothetical protein n=1 Tax=Clostridium botulinum TaxID=1491 RepID=UPI000C76741E|nr:hypothetical protein [Clostridium botulinum]AUN23779.1 hypothetical protein RSJ21_00310 [Clostridium botulinum]
MSVLQQDGILGLHGVIGNAKSDMGFNKTKRFVYDRSMSSTPAMVLQTFGEYISDNQNGLHDTGIFFHDPYDNCFSFYSFSNATITVKKKVGYALYPSSYGVSDGFITCYKSERNEEKFTVMKLDLQGNIQWETTIISKEVNAKPKFICEDSKNKNLIVSLFKGNNYNMQHFVFDKTGKKIKEWSFPSSDNPVIMTTLNTFAYDNILYGSVGSGYIYGNMNYIDGTILNSLAMSQTGDKTVAIAADDKYGYCFENGEVINNKSMTDIGLARSVPLIIDRNTFSLKNQNPQFPNTLVYGDKYGNLVEIDLYVKQLHGYYGNIPVNIRVMTEIYSEGRKPNQTIVVSPTGKTLMQFEGNISSVGNNIRIYRR